jgi:hypothetical protein
MQLKSLVDIGEKDEINIFNVDTEKNKEIELFFSRRSSCQEEKQSERRPS